MPVITQRPFGIYVFICAIILTASQSSQLYAQTLVGGSLYAESAARAESSNKLWLQYQNSFEFKERMFIDSDFGHIFHTNVRDKRLHVRSVFKYQLTENLKIGAGMGLFWYYDRPSLTQELRFVQEINYSKDFGSSIMFHDLRVEEQIRQAVDSGDDYGTRLRYRFGLHFPTNGPIYFGIYDEMFKNFSGGNDPFLSMNRAAAFIGFRTYQYLNLEAHVMMEDQYLKDANGPLRSFIFHLVARHII